VAGTVTPPKVGMVSGDGMATTTVKERKRIWRSPLVLPVPVKERGARVFSVTIPLLVAGVACSDLLP